MTKPEWRRISEVFAAALERPARHREAYVADVCGDDTALRHEVLTLLDADRESGAFMERPIGRVRPDDDPDASFGG